MRSHLEKVFTFWILARNWIFLILKQAEGKVKVNENKLKAMSINSFCQSESVMTLETKLL